MATAEITREMDILPLPESGVDPEEKPKAESRNAEMKRERQHVKTTQ